MQYRVTNYYYLSLTNDYISWKFYFYKIITSMLTSNHVFGLPSFLKRNYLLILSYLKTSEKVRSPLAGVKFEKRQTETDYTTRIFRVVSAKLYIHEY